MADCVFCKIVSGEIPSIKIFEDEKTLAFLDINPLTYGHCLIIPKEHYEDVFDIPFDGLKTVISNAKTLANNIKSSLSAKGVNLVNASGEAAGQSVPHFHIHIIPRYEDDKLEFNQWWQSKAKQAGPEELKKLAEQIKKDNYRN
ncbi:MAG: HIT family protein [Patescibacteria group bacterium]